MRMLIMVALLTGLSGQAWAQDCPSPEGWTKPARHVAAKNPRMRFALEPNSSAQLDLHVQRSVQLATKEGKQGWANSYAGLAAIDVERAGKLDVLLSSRAYVDLVQDGKTLTSSDTRRANCRGI